MIQAVNLIFALAFLLIWLLIYRKHRTLIIVLFPVFMWSSSRLVTGLFWSDIASVLWLYLLLFYKKNGIGILSFSVVLLLSVQVTINLTLKNIGNFEGGYWSTFVTPTHFYIPIIVFLLFVENNRQKIDLNVFFDHYNKFLFFVMVLLLIIKIIFIRLIGIGTMGDIMAEEMRVAIPMISSIAGFVSIATAVYVTQTDKIIHPSNIITFLVSIIIIILSETRGALMLFMILVPLALFMKVDLYTKLFLLFLIFPAFLSIGSFYLWDTLYSNPDIASIVNLYAYLWTDKGDFEGLISNEVVRAYLWTGARDVWFEHFWIGVGSGQFHHYFLVPGRDKLSPHHAFLSRAVEGGIITAILYMFPQIYFIGKLFTNRSYQAKVILVFSVSYVFLSIFMGYSFKFLFVIVLYLSLSKKYPMVYFRS